MKTPLLKLLQKVDQTWEVATNRRQCEKKSRYPSALPSFPALISIRTDKSLLNMNNWFRFAIPFLLLFFNFDVSAEKNGKIFARNFNIVLLIVLVHSLVTRIIIHQINSLRNKYAPSAVSQRSNKSFQSPPTYIECCCYRCWWSRRGVQTKLRKLLYRFSLAELKKYKNLSKYAIAPRRRRLSSVYVYTHFIDLLCIMISGALLFLRLLR